MKKKTASELRKAQIIKTARTLIRLKHSLAADEEINDRLPDTLEEFDKQLAKGQMMQLEKAVDILVSEGEDETSS